MLAAAATLSDDELRHDGDDFLAELWRAVDAVAHGTPATRRAVRSVLVSLLAEEPRALHARTLSAAIRALG